MTTRILVAGYLSIDTLSTAQGRSEGVPGGAALYAALAARRMGVHPTIAARVGEDYPQAWLDRLTASGIDTSLITRESGATRRARLVHMAAGGRTSAHFDDPDWWERTAALAPPLPGDLTPYAIAVAGPMPVERLSNLVRIGNRAAVPIVADTSEAVASRFGQDLIALLPRLDTFMPSREETRILCPGLTDDDAVHVLASRGPAIVQKRGAEGVAFCERSGEPISLLQSKPVLVADPTGAGDALVGAFSAGMALGRGFRVALDGAMALAAETVSGIGPSALGFPLDEHSGWEARHCA